MHLNVFMSRKISGSTRYNNNFSVLITLIVTLTQYFLYWSYFNNEAVKTSLTEMFSRFLLGSFKGWVKIYQHNFLWRNIDDYI